VTTAKLKVAHAVLTEGYDLLFTDSDVIWKTRDILQNVRNFVLTSATPLDAVFMCDTSAAEREKLPPQLRINSGFYFMVSNENTVDLLDPVQIDTILKHNSENAGDRRGMSVLNDQNYVRGKLGQPSSAVRFETLPLDYYANGNNWDSDSKRIGASVRVIHFTYPGKQAKVEKMMQHGMWYMEGRKVEL
jgi:hypothetical protein